MKSILLLQIVVLISTQTVNKIDQCQCNQLRQEADCRKLTTCQWSTQVTTSVGTCNLSTVQVSGWQSYCSQLIKPEENCAKTLGCAYFNEICISFSGCSAFVKQSNKECQAISTQCTTDGKNCIGVLRCDQYTTQQQCQGNASSSGNLKCKWDNNLCRDFTCDEADQSLTKDSDCQAYLTGCITSGRGCTKGPTLPLCSTYSECEGRKGSDGNCEGIAKQCTPKKCENAPKTYSTDVACAEYQINCITTLKGCIKAPLPLCSTYAGDVQDCNGMIGLDGICQKGGQYCKSRVCSEAPSLNTNANCSLYKSGCLTTGKGCIDQLGACSTYLGNTTTCLGYVGVDGNCKGVSLDVARSCTAMECADAPEKVSTDKECMTYQSWCRTTGKGCVRTLPSCTTYGSSCNAMTGIEGKCKLDSDGKCQVSVCEDGKQITNTECKNFLTGCVTTGSGCIKEVSCADTLLSISCDGTAGCGWNNICVANQSCSNFPTKGICLNTLAGTKKCVWEGFCRELKCNDAKGTIYNTDVACNQFMVGCVTWGAGCFDLNEPCTSYKGKQDQCSLYTRKCWNESDAIAISVCRNRQCIDNTTATTNQQCDDFKTGCVTNGHGCLGSDAPCSSYKGTTDQCNVFIGNGQQCYSDDQINCRPKVCTDKSTGASQDTDCGVSFLKGCTYDGKTGCISATMPCTSYQGVQSVCAKFKGENGSKLCWNDANSTSTSPCRNKLCSDAMVGEQACNIFVNDTCVLHKMGCMEKHQPCSMQSGTEFECDLFYGNDMRCQRVDQCVQRKCDDFKNPVGNTECVTYLATCRYQNNKCVDQQACTLYDTYGTTDFEKYTFCLSLTDTNNVGCGYIVGSSKCATRTCEQMLNGNQQSCGLFIANKCLFGNGKCMTLNACTSYSVSAVTTDKKQYCQALTNNNVTPKQCSYLGGNTCVEFICEDITTATKQEHCDAITVGCIYSMNQCFTPNTCESYSPQQIIFDNRRVQCQLLMSNETPKKQCTYYDAAVSCAAAKPCGDHNIASIVDSQAKIAYCKSFKNDQSVECIVDPINSAKCASYATCEAVLTPTSQAYCDRFAVNCIFNQSSCVTIQTTCPSYTAVGSSPSSQLAYCIKLYNSTNKLYCTFDSITNPTKCIDATLCTAKNSPATNQQAYCATTINKLGYPCYYSNAATTCRDIACSEILGATKLDDCNKYYQTPQCLYSTVSKACYTAALCNTYVAAGSTDALKLSYCTSMYDTTNQQCYQIQNGNSCITKGFCTTYDVTTAADKFAVCRTLQDKLSKDCTYITGTTCADSDACNNYNVSTFTSNPEKIAACDRLRDSTGTQCSWTSGNACRVKLCNEILAPATQADCDAKVKGCIYNTGACVIKGSCSSYVTLGSTAQDKLQYCAKMVDTVDVLCWWTAGDTNCRDRKCTDNTIATSDSECKYFKSGCKTNFKGCVDATTPCNLMSGTLNVCQSVTFNDAKCTSVAATTQGACTPKICAYDSQSTTDSQCDQYLKNCKTRGKGCIASTEPCSSYVGGKAICETFTGNGLKCTNDPGATEFMPCRVRNCEDNVIAESDAECAGYLAGCVTKGRGCFSKSLPCSAYLGTNAICSKFKGLNGVKYCWNSSITVASACRDKVCSDVEGKTDTDCGLGMPVSSGSDPLCVSDGKLCVSYPRSCKEYQGNDQACSTFRAVDGPCKSVSFGTNLSSCMPRVCSDAPNSYTTDQQCQQYHPSCNSNGYGCILKTRTCSDLVTQGICTTSQCAWVPNCRVKATQCSQMTPFGASVCVNTPLTNGVKCAWFNLACREITCEDLPATLNTHDMCYSVNNKCTTKGTGCTVYGICSSYLNPTTCGAARTTESSLVCQWDNTKCRPRVCTDLKAQSDFECNAFLKNCRTNGLTCLAATLSCSEIATSSACLRDSQNNTCYWVDKCYTFTKCQDIQKITYRECQLFSTQCTTDGTQCIPLTTCALNLTLVGCVKGTDGICGWLPAQNYNTGARCQLFKNCNEALGITKLECLLYSSTCITDGTKCIQRDTCQNYLSEAACLQDGTDGVCQWANFKCKLRECSDATSKNLVGITSHLGCYSFLANTKCTTDGAKCIPLAACSTYLESSCWASPDGECIYSNKVCRLKLCEDFPLVGSSCELIPLKQGCAYNGTICISKDKCEKYTLKSLCKSGGTDGICAFTETTGKCQLMTQCSDANSDKDACLLKKSVCQWQATTATTTTTGQCIPYTCATMAQGTVCAPVPSFDSTKLTVCVPQGGVCVSGMANTLQQSNCFSYSGGTYTWNSTTNQCQACVVVDSKPIEPTDDPTETTMGRINSFIGLIVVLICL